MPSECNIFFPSLINNEFVLSNSIMEDALWSSRVRLNVYIDPHVKCRSAVILFCVVNLGVPFYRN